MLYQKDGFARLTTERRREKFHELLEIFIHKIFPWGIVICALNYKNQLRIVVV